MSAELRSLTDHNAERANAWHELDHPQPAPLGIACPDCGAELVNPEPNVTLLSNPPKQHTACVCGYRGYALR